MRELIYPLLFGRHLVLLLFVIPAIVLKLIISCSLCVTVDDCFALATDTQPASPTSSQPASLSIRTPAKTHTAHYILRVVDILQDSVARQSSSEKLPNARPFVYKLPDR